MKIKVTQLPSTYVGCVVYEVEFSKIPRTLSVREAINTPVSQWGKTKLQFRQVIGKHDKVTDIYPLTYKTQGGV